MTSSEIVKNKAPEKEKYCLGGGHNLLLHARSDTLVKLLCHTLRKEFVIKSINMPKWIKSKNMVIQHVQGCSYALIDSMWSIGVLIDKHIERLQPLEHI